jgi:hypothetical protein
MQIVELTLNHLNLYCPVTGQVVCSEEDAFESPALAFAFIPESGEFNSIQEKYEEIYAQCEEICDDDFEHEPFDLFLEKLKDEPHLVMFTICTPELSSGPGSDTMHFCFDMNYHEVED